jgi:UDP-N-acetylglucosamine acyltransferase
MNSVNIHPTAVLHPTAELGENVTVGPYTIIGEDVIIGDGTTIGAHVLIDSHTHIGRDCRIYFGAALGSHPQDRKFQGERSYLRIGDRNHIREYVTLHRATGEDQATVLGDDNMLMNYAHLGHNCKIGSRIMIANGTNLGGHCIVEDDANLGGMTGIHQFVRIGRLAMVGGFSKVSRDVPPFMIVDGVPAEIRGLNSVGLRRAKMPLEVQTALKNAYRLLYRSGLNTTNAIERIRKEVPAPEEVEYLIGFVEAMRLGSAGRQLEAQRHAPPAEQE